MDSGGSARRIGTRREQVQAALLAALCAVLFLGPALLPGRALVPYSPEVWEPMRSAALARGISVEDLERGNLSMGDKYHQSFAWDRILQDRLREGEIPLWTRDIGGGVPFVPQMAQVYQPWNVLLLILPSVEWYGPVIFLHLLLLGWLAYRFFRRVGCVHSSAMLGLVCVVLGLWLQGRVHHNVFISAAVPLFPMLSAVFDLFTTRRRCWPIGVLGLAAGISWLGGFAPVSLQVTYLTGLFALVLAISMRRWVPLGWVALGFSLGGMIALAQMGPTLLANMETSRLTPTMADLASPGYGLGHLLGLFWPDLITWPAPGATDRPSVAGLLMLSDVGALNVEFTETAFSIGLAGMLAIAALRGPWWHEPEVDSNPLRGPLTVLFAGVAVVAFWLATATTPMLQISEFIPGARAGDLRRFLFSVYIALAVLAALGADRLAANSRRPLPIGLAVVVCLFSTAILVFHLQSVDAVREWYAEWIAGRFAGSPGVTTDAVRAAFAAGEVATNRSTNLAIGVRGVAISVIALVAFGLRARWTVWFLVVATVVELGHAGYGSRIAVESERVSTPPPILGPVLAATRATESGVRPRVMSLLREGLLDAPPRGLVVANLPGFWGVEHLGAYNPLPKLRMEQFFRAIEPDRDGKPNVVFSAGGSGVQALFDPASVDHPLLDLIGVEWILASTDCGSERLEDQTPDGVPAPFRIFSRSGAMPRATFVDTVRVVTDEADRLRILSNRDRDPRREVILEDPDAPPSRGDGVPDADVEFVEHDDEVVVIDITNREAGYLRLADPYDAGWSVQVDGAPRPLLVADHYFRAVWLEPGAHRVTFRFDALRVAVPFWIAFIGAIAGFVLMLVGVLRRDADRESKRIEVGPPAGMDSD